MEGDPKFEESQVIPDFNYASYANLAGLKGIRIDLPEQIAPAWDEALSADCPVVIDAVCDPERAADPAAHHLGADEGDDGGHHQRRSRCRGHHQEELQRQDEGANGVSVRCSPSPTAATSRRAAKERAGGQTHQ